MICSPQYQLSPNNDNDFENVYGGVLVIVLEKISISKPFGLLMKDSYKGNFVLIGSKGELSNAVKISIQYIN